MSRREGKRKKIEQEGRKQENMSIRKKTGKYEQERRKQENISRREKTGKSEQEGS